MSKISPHRNSVNDNIIFFSSDIIDESEPLSGMISDCLIPKKFHQNVIISDSSVHQSKAYLYSGYNEPTENDILPTLGFKLTSKISNLMPNDILTFNLRTTTLNIQFNIPAYRLEEFDYNMPYLLIPFEVLPDDFYKIKSLSLSVNNIDYTIMWNVFYTNKSDYVVFTLVNIFEKTVKIYKKPIRKYSFESHKLYYAVYCQCLLVDGVKTIYIPEYIIPRKKYLSYIYLNLINLYVNNLDLSLKKVCDKAYSLYNIKINPSTLYRLVKVTFNTILERESAINQAPSSANASAPTSANASAPTSANASAPTSANASDFVSTPSSDQSLGETATASESPDKLPDLRTSRSKIRQIFDTSKKLFDSVFEEVGLNLYQDKASLMKFCPSIMRRWLNRVGRIFSMTRNMGFLYAS
jgi:hypothetical protein